jgi:putative transposase
MPRSPRLDFPGARHHVMNRAARRDDFLANDELCVLFTSVIGELPERFGARVHGYALMPNHFHLMVETPLGNLSDAMQYVGATFTQAFNRRTGHDGPLFRGRFKNRVVQSDAYWRHLLAYLHLNPVKARLVVKPEDCLWTSHGAYVGSADRPRWLTTDELVASFGSVDALAEYVEGVRLHRLDAPASFDEARLWSTRSTDAVPEPPPPIPPQRPEVALAQVAALVGEPVDALMDRPRGRSANTAAWLAVWWLLESTALSQAGVGARLGISRARVSQVARRARQASRDDERLAGWMEELRAAQLQTASKM